MKRRWICGDVWLDILPFFDRLQLGLNLALLSDRFGVLVDAHFDAKTTDLTIWSAITIRKHIEMPKLLVYWMEFLLPDHPLPNKIRFENLKIEYIDHSVISFLHANKHIWDRSGTRLDFNVLSFKKDVQSLCDIFVRQIWPAFATNIRHLRFADAEHLENLRRLISPTILTDLKHLNAINSGVLCPDGIADDDGPNATAGQALAKWLHTPSKDGQPKRLRCCTLITSTNFEWVNKFKQVASRNVFVHAHASVNYNIHFFLDSSTPIVPFELKNERTKERLTLKKMPRYAGVWLFKRCSIIGEKDENMDAVAATFDWENCESSGANLNNVRLYLTDFQNRIGPLSPPAADKSAENVCSGAVGPSNDQPE